MREEREAWGPRPGLVGLDERGRDNDLDMLGVRAASPLRCPSSLLARADIPLSPFAPLRSVPPPATSPTSRSSSARSTATVRR